MSERRDNQKEKGKKRRKTIKRRENKKQMLQRDKRQARSGARHRAAGIIGFWFISGAIRNSPCGFGFLQEADFNGTFEYQQGILHPCVVSLPPSPPKKRGVSRVGFPCFPSVFVLTWRLLGPDCCSSPAQQLQSPWQLFGVSRNGVCVPQKKQGEGTQRV